MFVRSLTCLIVMAFVCVVAAAQDAAPSPSDQAPAKAAAAPAAEKPKTNKPPGKAVKKKSGPSSETAAPHPGKPPSKTGTMGVHKRRVSQALSGESKLVPEQTLKPPDWTQPMRDIEADVWEKGLKGDEISLKGKVRLRLDTTNFSSDEFWYSETTGEMRAKGHVLIVQDLDSLIADEMFYKVPEASQLPQRSILLPGRTEQEQAKLRLSSGALQGTNVTIIQPDEELHASYLEYNIADQKGFFDDASGSAGVYYFKAEKLRVLGPNNMDAENLSVTTCDHDPPHYHVEMKEAMIREGKAVYGKGARLYIGNWASPVYWPQWGYKSGETGAPLNFDFNSGHHANIGYYINAGQQFALSPEAKLGLRFYPTTKGGVGLGLESQYDFTKDPASPLFLGRGDFHSLYTTHDRGYLELHHRQEVQDDTVMLVQAEAWTDKNFYRDFFYQQSRNRSDPRSFVNVTHTQPGYIATGTVSTDLTGFVHETERTPEGTFHLLERPVAKNLYVSFDTIDGYNKREPVGTHALRTVNVGRLTYDLNLGEGLNVTPFWEAEATAYSEKRHDDDPGLRLANTVGATTQTRFSRAYPGALGFSGFKHLVVPSLTVSYRPTSTLAVEDAPRFDAYDSRNGRARIETKIDNILFGRDAETEQVWQVARLSLYEGADFWNEVRNTTDYEAEMDLRPRAWWGCFVAAEHHGVDDSFKIDEPFLIQNTGLRLYERIAGRPYNDDLSYQYGTQYGDYDRILTYLYYDDTEQDGKFSSRVGYSYTETHNSVFNRQVLYGAGYKLGDNWGVAFEHRYDLEHNEMAQQKYEIRRRLHCWEAVLMFRERPSGWDFGIAFNIAAFPGTRVKF